MIDTIKPVTVTKSGLDVLRQGDSPLQLFTFGKILLIRKDHCIVLVSAGPLAGQKVKMELTFPMTWGDGSIYHVVVPAEAAPAADKPVRAPRVKAAPGETKIAKCRAIYVANADLDKDAMIAKFVADAGCTPAGAVTYYITCRKG